MTNIFLLVLFPHWISCLKNRKIVTGKSGMEHRSSYPAAVCHWPKKCAVENIPKLWRSLGMANL